MDIQIGMETVALGLVGVDQMLAWGAGHRGDDEHAWADWEACQSCQQWRYERLEARERLVAAGVDAVRWLGETDDPAKFGN
jgi:hypothetical protein